MLISKELFNPEWLLFPASNYKLALHGKSVFYGNKNMGMDAARKHAREGQLKIIKF